MQVKIRKQEFVCQTSDDMAFCHASTVARFSPDEYLVAWFGGPDFDEKSPRGRIWAARRSGSGWSAPAILCDHAGLAHLNPVLFQPDAHTLVLFYHVGRSIREWVTWYKTSRDHGASWSEARPVADGMPGGRGPVRNKPIVLADGTWLAPAAVERETWDCFVDRSTDRGQTWTASPLVPVDHAGFRGVIQPALWESAPGCVHMLMRSTAGQVYRSDSQDGGATWAAAYPTPLPNNNSAIALTKWAGSRLALVYNPVGVDFGPRVPLCLAVSDRTGERWETVYTLEGQDLDASDPAYRRILQDHFRWTRDRRYEFSYPDILAHGDTLVIMYTWRRERIAFWELELEEGA